jgi:glyoxylase-like metal-dependent hydrolase (beta-lactamase superfamily II)
MIEIQQFTFGPLQENTFLLINGKKECIIIDPGCYFQDEIYTNTRVKCYKIIEYALSL